MTKHTLRARIFVKFNRWFLASVAGGCGTTFASRSKQPATAVKTHRRRGSPHQFAPAEGPMLPLRLRQTPHSDDRAWLNPHRAR